MSAIPVGLQLFSVRGECQNDLANALKCVADIGYVGAEPWGYGGDKLEWLGHPAADIRKMFDDNGLSCMGIHLQTNALLGDNLKRTAEFNQILGNQFLIIAGDKARMSTRDTVMELAGILNTACAALKPEGLFVGYHAHPFDFEDFGDVVAWDLLFASTCDNVIMQVDVGNSARGGADPIRLLGQFPGRARSVHLKDFGGPEGSVIGEGTLDWPTIFRLCETVQKTERYVVEECGPNGLGFDVPARAFRNLQGMGKA